MTTSTNEIETDGEAVIAGDAAGSSERPREFESIRGYVHDTIWRIYRAWESNPDRRGIADPRVRAVLARLRRSAASPPGTSAEVWEHLPGDPATCIRGSLGSFAPAGEATPQEIAVHHALVLWAFHQQSKTDFMHDGRRAADGGPEGRSFAEAVRRLSGARDGEREAGDPGPVRRRFVSVARAQSIDAMVAHARGLIQQLRDEGIAFDYGRFAEDLLRFQFPGERSRVQRQWGRDFQRFSAHDDTDQTAEPGTNDDAQEA